MRLDLYLVDKGFVNSRARANNLIKLKAVKVDGNIVTKAAFSVKEDSVVTVEDCIKYSSLGGLKLEKAIKYFDISVSGIAIDIGASNGGFTDCLLQYGATKVYAVDVGTTALSDKLLADDRVVVMDKTNARNLTPNAFGESVDIITIDVSFISVLQILPIAKQLIHNNGVIIALIKPQFEVGKRLLPKSGIVINAKDRQAVVNEVIKAAKEFGLICKGYIEAPILFEDKNIEYLAKFVK